MCASFGFGALVGEGELGERGEVLSAGGERVLNIVV
jgi:hypothetical protein